jgi:UDP-2,4-diacetamido-2,4,6-trideoxy-beta-L-altropyranose hydrolase
MRCLVLADALAARGWRCYFAVGVESVTTVPALAASAHEIASVVADAETEADWMKSIWPEGCALLVVDHYGRAAALEKNCRGWSERILVIDDLGDRAHECDLLLDQSLGREAGAYDGLVPDGCRLLMGPDFALLRPQFASARKAALARREGTAALSAILVSVGLTDPSNLTGLALKAIGESGLEVEVTVILGAAAPHHAAVEDGLEAFGHRARLLVAVDDMAGPMTAVDLAIGAAGSSSWERCCLGLPTILLVASEHEKLAADPLCAAGVAEAFGRDGEIELAHVAQAIRNLAADPALLAQRGRKAAAVCDGLGADKVAAAADEMF